LKIDLESWREVEPLLSKALEMERGERDAWLAGLEARHPAVAPLLRRLIASHERAERSSELEGAPRLETRAPWSSRHVAGERLGPFDLERPLGRGGMGEVWLARQVDGRVDREVALKLPVLPEHGDAWRERFRRERDILARLEHPHIARFYDAGVAEGGQPWLAMECVFGSTLLEHAAARSLSLRQRLELFRQVLAAVGHAHRHLVVHRDLKPANILVDEAGEVKLLDFGIAKLVEEGAEAQAGDLTRLGGRVMTLRYAAPEQVEGGGITTATDIYALGVVLHELVTGLSPYRAVRDGKPLTEGRLLEGVTTLPSKKALSADLNAIVLKAMRPRPAERYASVELLDADVAAYLQGKPVKARAGTWRYLGARFAARHRLPLGLGAAFIASLVAALVVVEQGRREALAEKARAERHFGSVRKLANTFMVDVHDRIRALPGSLAAREALIATSLAYLDALAREPGRDPALLLDLATAYLRIASIQGEPREANRGNLAASIANYEKAQALFVELERLGPVDVSVTRERWHATYSLAMAYFQVTDRRWATQMRLATQLAERVSATPGAGVDDLALGPFARAREAHLACISYGRTGEVAATMIAGIDDLERHLPRARPESALRSRLLTLYFNAGMCLSGSGDIPRQAQSLGYFGKALALARELHAAAPAEAPREMQMVTVASTYARWLAVAGEHSRADALMRESIVLVDRGVVRDPDDVTVAVRRLEVLVGAADLAIRMGDLPRAMGLGRDVLEGAARLPAEAARLRDVRMQSAEANVLLGYALVSTAEAAKDPRERRIAMLEEARTRFAAVSRFLDEQRAEPSLGAVPEHKLREFAAAQARLERAFAAIGAR
jgi:tetratricopeptide (TPR) repeat protein